MTQMLAHVSSPRCHSNVSKSVWQCATLRFSRSLVCTQLLVLLTCVHLLSCCVQPVLNTCVHAVGCTQRPHYTQCQWKHSTCEKISAHYQTIPCESDAQCRGFGTCGDVYATCLTTNISNSHNTSSMSQRATTSRMIDDEPQERICMVASGGERGAMCGWY